LDLSSQGGLEVSDAVTENLEQLSRLVPRYRQMTATSRLLIGASNPPGVLAGVLYPDLEQDGWKEQNTSEIQH
jgi:hypothetical protein